MFKAMVLKEIWHISSRRRLVKLLDRDKSLLSLCGFNRPLDHPTFTKFVKRIGPDISIELFKEWVK